MFPALAINVSQLPIMFPIPTVEQTAIGYWKKAIEVNPWNWQFFNELAFLRDEQRDWKAAAEQCQKALELYPADLETRKLLAQCYLRLGDETRAQAEMNVLQGLNPDLEKR